MPSTFTPSKNYQLQATGEDLNSWGINLNANFSLIDNNLGGTLNISVAGNSNVTLSLLQAQYLIHVLSGVLTGNIEYIFPAGGVYQITNNTTGAFTVTVIMAGGTGAVVPQGETFTVMVDALNLVARIDSVASNSLPAAEIYVGNASGVASAVPVSGDATISTTGALTVTKSQGTAIGTAAFYNTGSSGTTIGLLNGNNTWSGTNAFVTQPITDNSTKAATTAFAKTAMTTQTLVSGSGTYTTPSGVLFLKLRLVGGGGGGGGGGGAGGAGGTTTFGSSLLTANGGTGGGLNAGGSPGGSASVAGGALGIGLTGGSGGGGGNPGGATVGIPGGVGGSSALGGGGAGGSTVPSGGGAGATNTGGGGGGGGCNNAGAGTSAGSGGGSGGFVDATIVSPSATYSYAVGAAGSAGASGGTGGSAGGAGGSGIIIVEEFYIG